MSSKVVLITGCSEGGTGFAMCQKFAAAGCIVYATARNVEKMKGLTFPNVSQLALDVTDASNIGSVVDTIIGKEGKIDILVNNAGISAFGPVLEVPIEQVREVYEANVFSILLVSRAVIPHMAARKSGLIINIGSVVGEIPTPWAGVYSSSKAAVHNITEVLEMEGKAFNVKTMLVSPGGVKTNIATNASPKYTPSSGTLYRVYQDNINTRMWASQVPGAMAAEVFAEIVVRKALSSSPPWYLLVGLRAYTILVRVLKLFPREWRQSYMWKRFATLKNGK